MSDNFWRALRALRVLGQIAGIFGGTWAFIWLGMQYPVPFTIGLIGVAFVGACWLAWDVAA